MKITPVLVVDSVDASLIFWVDLMGFEKTAEVPEGDTTGFAIVQRDGAELMIQSVSSVRNDVPQFAEGDLGSASVFIEVSDFNDVLFRLSAYPIAMPQRTTFYGMREIGVREPGGHIVIFASPVA